MTAGSSISTPPAGRRASNAVELGADVLEAEVDPLWLVMLPVCLTAPVEPVCWVVPVEPVIDCAFVGETVEGLV